MDESDDIPGDKGECDGACQAASPQSARGGEGVAHGGRPRHDQVAGANIFNQQIWWQTAQEHLANFLSNIPRGGQLLEMFATGTAACVVPVP